VVAGDVPFTSLLSFMRLRDARPFMPNTIKLILLVVAAGIFAVFARVLYVRAAQPEPTVDASRMVRIAAVDLPEGLLLREDDFGWRKVNADAVPSGAIVKDAETKELKGALLRHALTKDALITAADVIVSSDPGFLAAILKPDMRAVSVAIDDVSGNAGLIQPGDYIDLLLTQTMDRQDASRDMSITSETVAQRVRVLAVGSEFQRPKESKEISDARANARTVTLEVTPHRAEVIAVAAKLGSLSLALRSFARAATVPGASEAADDVLPPVYAGDISQVARQQRQTAPVATAPSTAPHPMSVDAPVQIFRGSEKNTALVTADASTSNWNAGMPPLPPLPSSPGAAKIPALAHTAVTTAPTMSKLPHGDLMVAQ
jgi:pilus assembly protein CpaB